MYISYTNGSFVIFEDINKSINITIEIKRIALGRIIIRNIVYKNLITEEFYFHVDFVSFNSIVMYIYLHNIPAQYSMYSTDLCI